MKIATVGKGGSGKTTIAGTLTRIFADDGRKMLAIDGDPNPNLALTLGMSRDKSDNITYIPASVMKRGGRGGWCGPDGAGDPAQKRLSKNMLRQLLIMWTSS